MKIRNRNIFVYVIFEFTIDIDHDTLLNGLETEGCTTFRLSPFRRIDTLYTTTIGLKTSQVRHLVEKNIRILDEMSQLF